MKVLFFADLHGNIYDLEKLKQKAKKADLVACAGDLTIFENDMKLILEELNSIKKTVLVIHGNHEDDFSLKRACTKFKFIRFIHESFFKRDDILFLGYGGGGFRMKDDRFEKQVAKKFERLMKDAKKTVILFHGPPHNTKLDFLAGEYVGNKSYTRFIKKNQPNLVICGHIHESAGKKHKIRKSLVVNPGPRGKIIRI